LREATDPEGAAAGDAAIGELAPLGPYAASLKVLCQRLLRARGAATALFALLTLSLRRLARNCSMLAITRSPARWLRT